MTCLDASEDHALPHGVEAARIGGRIVLVGIPQGDRYELSAAEARRKGLTILLSRRMGDVYPRAIELARRGWVDVQAVVTHRFSLEQAAPAVALQARYAEGVLKAMVYQDEVRGGLGQRL